MDAKVPLTAYLEAVEAGTGRGDVARRSIATRVRCVSTSRAWRSATTASEHAQSAEFVVLFIPNDRSLRRPPSAIPSWSSGRWSQQVVIATPATFVALLRAIEHGWRQVRRRGARAAHQRRRPRAERAHGRARRSLVEDGRRARSKTVESYNQAVGSFKSRLLPTARKLEQLGARTRRRLRFEPVEHAVRPGRSPELLASSRLSWPLRGHVSSPMRLCAHAPMPPMGSMTTRPGRTFAARLL